MNLHDLLWVVVLQICFVLQADKGGATGGVWLATGGIDESLDVESLDVFPKKHHCCNPLEQ